MKRRKNSKAGSILYLMIHLPFFWWVKIGITGKTASRRAKGLDEAMFGFPVPIFFVWIPGAYFVEQALHAMLFGLKCDFYNGDGHTEWFWLPAAALALPVMAAIWYGYYLIFLELIKYI